MEGYIFINIFYCVIICLVLFLCSLRLYDYCEKRKEETIHDEYSLI